MSHKFSMDMSWLGLGVQCRDTQLVNTWGSKATWCGTRACLVTAQPCFHHAVCRAGYHAPLEWQHICLESNWPQTTEPQRELAATEVPGWTNPHGQLGDTWRRKHYTYYKVSSNKVFIHLNITSLNNSWIIFILLHWNCFVTLLW